MLKLHPNHICMYDSCSGLFCAETENERVYSFGRNDPTRAGVVDASQRDGAR